MTHQIKYMERSAFDHTFRCTCGATPDPKKPPLRTLQMAQDEGNKHLALVARVQKQLGHRGQDLAPATAYYREQAANPNVDAKDRELWEQLAGEGEKRLGVGVEEVQEEMFPVDEVRPKGRGLQ